MAALGAIFRTDSAPDGGNDLARMENALRSMAPGGGSARSFGAISLYHGATASFTPQDMRDRQPVLGMDGRWAVAFCGFLTARDELAESLGIAQAEARQMPDSQLVLAGWEKWQDALPAKLCGDFALLVADLAEGELHAARSGYSALPLYFHEGDGRIAVASVPRGLFALENVPRVLDEQRLADAMVHNFEELTRSLYRDIKVLPLGHQMRVSRKGVALTCHYRPEDTPPLRLLRDEDYVDAANELLDRCVGDTLRANAMPGIMLSSGLDSSSVAVSAMGRLEQHGQWPGARFDSYTHVPGPGWDGRAIGLGRVGDERAPVEALAAMYPQLHPHFVDSAQSTIDGDWDLYCWLAEAPLLATLNQYWVWDIARKAKRDGHDVLLTGGAGNATISFDGASIFADLFRKGRWVALLREHWRVSGNFPSLRGLYPRAIRPNLPPGMVARIAGWRRDSYRKGWRATSPINPGFARDMQVDRRAQDMGWDSTHSQAFHDHRAHLARMHGFGARDQGQAGIAALEVVAGVQIRDPLRDKRLVEFCHALPRDQFYRDGQMRRLVRRMMHGRLPEEILHASRGRQAADSHNRISRELPRMREEVERMADDPDLAARFDTVRLRRALDTWPERTPLDMGDHPDFLFVLLGLPQALATARFIRWVQGKN